MQTTKNRLAVAMAAPVMALGTTALVGLLNLPTTPVRAIQDWVGAAGVDSTINAVLTDVPPGFDVSNGEYDAWCIEDNGRDDPPPTFDLILVDSTDPAATGFCYPLVAPETWDKVNYLLNHKNGTVVDVQHALWLLTWGSVSWNGPPSAAAAAMFLDADTNGAGFVPAPGEIVAVILWADGIGPNGYQDTLIEMQQVCSGDQGLTPGFWKNHERCWVVPRCDDFDSTFGVDYFRCDITLFQAVWRRGGQLNRVARHGTAAYLNALHPGVNYPYTVAEVIAYVQAGDVDDLEIANELGAELACAPHGRERERSGNRGGGRRGRGRSGR